MKRKGLLLILLCLCCSACATGYKAGVYYERVDARTASESASPIPLKCLFVSCDKEA